MRYAIVSHPDAGLLQRWREAATAAGLMSLGLVGATEAFADRRSRLGLSEPACLLIGSFFRDRTSSDLSLCCPATLLASGWGEYVALFPHPAGVRLLRDASGAVPCYVAGPNGGLLVASDLSTFEAVLGRRLRLDWHGVEHCLRSGDLRTARPAIEGLTELLPGQMLSWSPDREVIETAWSPWPHVDRAAGLSLAEQARDFASVMMQTVDRLAEGRGKLLVTASGGLDSSIVAAALTAVGRPFDCITIVAHDPAGDERRYARLIAEKYHAPLFERFLDSDHVDLTKSHSAHLPRPTGRPFAQSTDRLMREVAAEIGANAVFHGSGGDNVCGFLQSAAPVADQILQGRLRDAIGTARDVADLNRVSVVEAMRAGVVRASAGRGKVGWKTDHRFLTPPKQTVDLSHPWLAVPRTALPGQVARIVLLLRIQNYLEMPLGGTALQSALPYLAQPVVERCLAIPSWQWCAGGRDRAVARCAFASHLPDEIVARRWKGGPDGFLGLLFDRNRRLLRDHLIDGVLADRGLIDRAAVDAVLIDPRPPSGADALRLLGLADAEAWVRGRS